MGMALRNLPDMIDRQDWLVPVGERVQQWVSDAFAARGETGRKIKNFLHGTWLGHPLHPALTDVPLGAWTAGCALDALEAISGSKTLARAADAVTAIGIMGAVGSAASGLTDWHDTYGLPRARRVGLAHGLLNMSATLIYALSLLYRLRGARDSGRGLALLGYTVASAAAYLGGDLVYGEHLGTNHAARKTLPTDFVPVLADADLPGDRPRRVDVNGTRVVLVRRGGRIYALAETCSHLGGALSGGHLGVDSITCPWHGSRFALEDGRVLDGPATFPQPCFEARVREGQIEIRQAQR